MAGMEKAAKRPSMADVGRVADVSAQTVSRYYTGGYVSSATRAKIEAAVSQLRYQHNRLPQILRSRFTETLGFLAMGPLNYGSTGIVTGINRAAQAEGQSLLTAHLDLRGASAEQMQAETHRVLQSLLSMRVDGLLVGTPYPGVESLLDHASGGVPVVSLSESVSDKIDSVHTDSYGAARLAVEHLFQLGHRQIIHVAGPLDRNEASERIRGYRDGLEARGIAPLPLVLSAEWDASSGFDAASRTAVGTFTGVVAANDEIALGFLSYMRARGVLAPADFSIVGIDDMPEAAFFYPALTSASLQFEEIGEKALRILLNRIRGLDATPNRTSPSRLNVRDSTRRI